MNIVKHDTEEDLVMDLYFPNILTGQFGTPDSPEEVLGKLKEVDGSGSGVDADTVDGKHAGDFILKNKSLAGQIVVVKDDGEIAGGGNFREFEEEFKNNASDIFK